MARRVSGGLKLFADFSSVAEFIGAGQAFADVDADPAYLDAIVHAAHKQAEHAFNTEAAAAAEAGTNIKHMFEWGTLGINRARTNMRPNPLSERARLWTTHMMGRGLNQTLTYTFKPSLAIVPKPTVRDTGMDVDTISHLSDHIFTWKAEVMETGAMVTIIPKNAKFLLIPYYASQRGNVMFSKSDIARGFTLSKGPHSFSPGDVGGTTGNFTAFWSGWWESQGQQILERSIEAQITEDYVPAIQTNFSTGRPIEPDPASFISQVRASKKKTQAEALAKARGRNVE